MRQQCVRSAVRSAVRGVRGQRAMYAPGEGVVDEALQLTHEHLVHIGLQLGHMGLQPGLLRLQSRYIGL